MPGQLNNAVKEARSKAAIAVANEMSLAFRKALVGTTQTVLFEEPEGDYFVGHTPNYVKVYFSGENLRNTLLSVEITEVFGDGVLAVSSQKK